MWVSEKRIAKGVPIGLTFGINDLCAKEKIHFVGQDEVQVLTAPKVSQLNAYFIAEELRVGSSGAPRLVGATRCPTYHPIIQLRHCLLK